MPTQIKRTVTVIPAAFPQKPFTYSPMMSRSLTKSIRKASAGGMASTAITFTVSTTNSSGARGISTRRRRGACRAEQRRIEGPGVAHRPVEAVTRLHDFAECVSRGRRNRDGGHDSGLENTEREERGARMPDPRIERLGELRCLELRRVNTVMKQRNRGENRGDREHSGQHAPRSVSNRPALMSRGCMPLSTTALCWKKIIHGVTVAPISARISSRISDPLPFGSGVHVSRA